MVAGSADVHNNTSPSRRKYGYLFANVFTVRFLAAEIPATEGKPLIFFILLRNRKSGKRQHKRRELF